MWFSRKNPEHELHEQILAGNVGCMFAKEAAEEGKIAYATVDARPKSTERSVEDALQAYIDDKKKRVLMLLSNREPKTWAKGKEQAMKIYEHMLAGLRKINEDKWYELANDMPELNIRSMWHQLPSLLMQREEIIELVRQPELREQLCEEYAARGPVSLKYIDAVEAEVRSLFCFAMAPYYEKVTNIPHSRWSPHFCVAVTEQQDINKVLAERQRDVDRTQQWEVAAAGKRYSHGFHPREK